MILKTFFFFFFFYQRDFYHPVGNDVNCSGVSKPGWSSHWGSVLGFNVSEECSLWNKKINSNPAEARNIQHPKGSARWHTTFLESLYRDLTFSPLAHYPKRQTRTVEVGIRAHGGKYTAELALQRLANTPSGTTSLTANCNWAVDLISNHRACNPVTSPGSVRIQGLA